MNEAKKLRRERIERGIYEYPTGSETYYIYWYHNGRRQKQKIGCGKNFLKIARDKLTAIRADLIRGTYIDQRAIPKILFKDFAVDYLEYCHNKTRINKEWTRDIYQENVMKKLLPIFGSKLLSQIYPEDIEKYKGVRQGAVKNRSVNLELSVLSHMFNMAIKWKKVSINPMKDVDKLPEEETPPKFLSEKEIIRLYENCTEHLLPIVKLAISTGVRRGALLNTKWPAVNLDKEILYVPKSKSGKAREIPLSNTAFETLKGIKRHPQSEYVFCDSKGNKYSNVRKSFETAMKKAGLDNLGYVFNTLRHTFASHLVMSGVDLTTVKDLMGHADYKTTMKYAHLSRSHKREAIAMADAVFSGLAAKKQRIT